MNKPKPDESRPPIISYEQINHTMDSYDSTIREHDGMTFAIEIANIQRDLTASILKAQEQKRVEGILSSFTIVGGYVSGGEGGTKYIRLEMKLSEWQVLKNKEVSDVYR